MGFKKHISGLVNYGVRCSIYYKRKPGKSSEIGINRVFPTINRNILIAVCAEIAIFAVKF